MKKSINITLNGLVFSLEEDAYEMLKNYLDSIKNYYEGPEEEKEILSDIESSIAEKFSEKLKLAKQAITLADVEEIIKIMGTVEEITELEETNEKKENVKEETQASKKRLYRDTDDVIIAGVASGIAAYFGIDPVFVRIIFVILAFANGIGILVYLVFWIAMPKATTNTQKLEMRGKPVNLAEIQQAVKEKSKMIGEEGRDVLGRLRKDNTFRKILNFPVRVVEIIFLFIKNVFRIFLPMASIFFGILALIGSVFTIIGLSIASALMVFNINSPYLISDLPLNEIASTPFYYIGVISLYAVCVIPMFFLSALGITMIRRRNSFNLIGSSILIGVWMIVTVIFVVAAVDLVPMVKARVDEINKQETVTKNFDYKDFSELAIGGEEKIKITKGDNYSIKLSGRQADLDRLEFKNEKGLLEINQKPRENKGICIFCFNKDVNGEITMPQLNAFNGADYSNADISGFEKDINISLRDYAYAKFKAKGGNLKADLRSMGRSLELSGNVKNLEANMSSYSRLTAEELTAQKIILTMDDYCRADLDGQAKEFEANMKSYSELTARNLQADSIKIEAKGYANAEVWAKNKLTATSSDYVQITYKGEPKELTDNATEYSSIKKSDEEGEVSADDNKIFIKTDVE